MKKSLIILFAAIALCTASRESEESQESFGYNEPESYRRRPNSYPGLEAPYLGSYELETPSGQYQVEKPYPPVEEGSYPMGPPYPQPSIAYGPYELRTIKAHNVVKPEIEYYTKENINFAVVSCPLNPTPGAYTWIVAGSRHTSPLFSIPGTVALAGGVNVEFVAHFDSKHEEWVGREFKEDHKTYFHRVGCVHGSTQSFIQH